MVRMTWYDLINKSWRHKRLYIYGAGEYGKLAAVALMEQDYKLTGFIDSDTAKWGQDVLGGVKCVSIQDIDNIDSDCLVVIAVANVSAQESICQSLDKSGVGEVDIFSKEIHDCIYKKISSKAFGEYYFSVIRQKNKFPLLRAELDRRKFQLDYFMPGISSVKNSDSCCQNRKIKVRIAILAKYLLNSYETLYRAFAKDEGCEVAAVVPDFYKQRFGEDLDAKKYNVLREEEYDASIDKPDILILTFQHQDSIFFPHIYHRLGYFKLVVAATASLVSDDPVEKFDNCLPGYHYYQPDFYLVDAMMYQLAQRLGTSYTMYEMANCKFDGIYKSYKRGKFYPDGWEKLRDKRVVLWSNDHGVYEKVITHRCSFDLYAKTIFDYAAKHENMGFVVRLHPAFLDEMMQWRMWTRQDIDYIAQYCASTPNLVWDARPTYDAAYAVADAIIVDPFCGMTFSALPLQRPICVTYRHDIEVTPSHQELLDNYYSVRSQADLIKFLDMISADADPMVGKRKLAADKYIKHFDGHNGERMRDFILEKFREKIMGCER